MLMILNKKKKKKISKFGRSIIGQCNFFHQEMDVPGIKSLETYYKVRK